MPAGARIAHIFNTTGDVCDAISIGPEFRRAGLPKEKQLVATAKQQLGRLGISRWIKVVESKDFFRRYILKGG